MVKRSGVVALVLAVACLIATVTAGSAQAQAHPRSGPWPAHGQAAYALGGGATRVSPGAHVVPIASLSKMMTAYLVLRAHPVRPGANGFTMRVTSRDVADWHRRVGRDESTVAVRTGERLTERQALAALLLPSANNIAIMLARHVSGSVSRFVRLMNHTARSLHMSRTTYTDPSGFDARTRSVARDQLRVASAAMRITFFRAMVSRTQYRVPVAGIVHNTDKLLHHDGFTGIKTGSMNASRGCFAFRSVRIVHGHRVAMTGVVLNQPGGNLVDAALTAARRLVDRVAPRAG